MLVVRNKLQCASVCLEVHEHYAACEILVFWGKGFGLHQRLVQRSIRHAHAAKFCADEVLRVVVAPEVSPTLTTLGLVINITQADKILKTATGAKITRLRTFASDTPPEGEIQGTKPALFTVSGLADYVILGAMRPLKNERETFAHPKA